jgi:hypothetical protein
MSLIALPLAMAAALAAMPPQDTLPVGAPADSLPITAAVGVAPDTVTVGDPFRAVVRVLPPAGARVDFPEFGMTDPVEARGAARIVADSSGAWTATYPLVAWSTGDSMVAAISLTVTLPSGEPAGFRVRVPLPVVRSVLPADSTLHVPRPAKAVVPIAVPGRPRGWLLPAALLAGLLAAVGWLVLRRRRYSVAPAASPREAALARLAEIEEERLLERGEAVEYHVRVSRVLREYLARVGMGGEELTTTETMAAARGAAMAEAEAAELERLLRQGDTVKFAEAWVVGAGPMRSFGADAKQWISAWPPEAESAARAGTVARRAA